MSPASLSFGREFKAQTHQGRNVLLFGKSDQALQFGKLFDGDNTFSANLVAEQCQFQKVVILLAVENSE